MAYLDHQEAYEDFKQAVLEGIRRQFPVVGSVQRLELDKLEVKDPDPDVSDDLRAQHDAKVKGETWSSPVFATLSLKNKNGDVIQQKKIRIAEIPRVSSRYSYIVDGQEYQVDSQWQLKPGVYTRRMANGKLETRFNTPTKKEFRILFEPETKQFVMNRGKSKKIPVYPLMKALGVDDSTMESAWGKEIFAANKLARGASGALTKVYKADRKIDPANEEEAVAYFRRTMTESYLDPEVTKITLGKAASNIDGDVLLRSTKRLMEVQAGAPEDDRDSLEFKRLRTTGDYAFDKMTDWKTSRAVQARMTRQVNHATDIRQVVKFTMMNDPIMKTFKQNTAARPATQINPLEMVAASQQTTIMGPGGIQSQRQIDNSINLKLVNPSHLGFLDPVKTPESEKTGVILRLPTGIRKMDGEAKMPLYNLKTGKIDYLGPTQFHNASVVLPDQVTWESGKPKPKSDTVSMSAIGNKLTTGKFKDAQYVMRHPSQLFSLTTNLIPFLGSTSGNRATYAGFHLEQAISLKNREAPLVQVGTGTKDPDIDTFEGILGRQAGHVALKSGVVTEVHKDAVVIKSNDGKTHEVQLYNNFPLNETKSVLHSTPIVKVGDQIKAGQSVADTNYTRGGRLALGTNLRVAYIPFKGYNFEDGVVISRSAANKMTSEHLYKESTKLADNVVRDIKKFRIQHQGAFSEDQYKKLDESGVVRIGQKVMPGDPLVIAMTPYNIKDRMGISAVRRSLSGAHTDSSMRWKSDYPGEVVAVHQRGDGTVAVHVRTEEPMQVGDKITGRYGNKGIVTQVIDDDKMPRTKDGKHIEVALNPSGVPGRMNLGQVLETAAAKIALKTGKPYIVHNFDGSNAVEKVKADLRAHGISDQEELIDPETGLSLGKAMVGPQHMLKLVHQIDKKVSVRSGMPARAGELPEKYDNNLIPAGTGKIGAQSIGHNGLYTMLAHGAKANIREMQTWKSEGEDAETHPGKKWPSQHSQVWEAIQTGEPLPTPTTTFSFQKFTDMLKAAGVNVEKQGHQLKLLPFTDKQILSLSNGEFTKPDALTYSKLDSSGNLKPQTGGLFDPKITGGIGGKGWGHVRLPEPVANPVFEGAIRKLTNLKQSEYDNLVSGTTAVDRNGKFVKLGTPGAVTGGSAIKRLLDAVDVDKELASATKQLNGIKLTPSIAHGASTQKVDVLVKKIKYLRTLQQAGMKPSEAYVLHNLPIIPPAMRPPSIMDGDVSWHDLNGLYHNLGQIVVTMRDPLLQNNLTDEGKAALRLNLYDGVKAVMGLDKLGDDEKKKKGIVHLISGGGKQPKYGFFQQTLLKRKQDLTMRSTIIPEPALGLDEIGLPKDKALSLYKPFVVRKLVEMGAATGPLAAQQLIKSKDKYAYRALEMVTDERPVLLKRDPALHKHSIQAFRPKLVSGSAIQIHPLTTNGYNADFDGDSIDLDTPIPLRIDGNVTMQTGRQLVELLNAGDGNYICETRGVEAWTYDGWRLIKNVSFHTVEEKRKFRVTLKNGVNFIVSEDHSLMVGRKEIKPTQLSVGVELDHASQITPGKAREGGLYEQGVAYGNFLGDGCAEVRRQGGGRISIACLPPVEREYLMNIWRVEFEGNPSPYVYGFHVNGVDLARHFLEVCGRYCDGKFVGDFLLNRGPVFLKGLLAGYILSDGSVELTKSGSYLVRTWSRSKRLRDGMSLVATMLGLPHALRERVAKGKTNYIISFGKEAIKLLDYRCPGKKGELIRQALHDYEHDRNDDRRSQSARGFEVSSIEEVAYEDRMIDIEVEDEQHVFAIFGGVIVHNTMSAYVPVSPEAVKEAQGMFPSSNLFNEATGKVIYTPTLEAALGLFKLSRITGDSNKSFSTPNEALKAVKEGKLDVTKTVFVQGKKTTPGRLLIAAALPQAMQKDYLNADPNLLINKDGLNKLFETLAKNHKAEFGMAANRLKDLGNGASYGAIAVTSSAHQGLVAIAAAEGKGIKRDYIPIPTHSLSLDDFSVDHATRQKFVNQAQKEVAAIQKSRAPSAEKERQVIQVWNKATDGMTKAHFEKVKDNPSNLALMVAADVKPSKSQYRQMVLSPGILEDATGRPIPVPVTRSYSEGLDIAGYWTQSHGARGGTIKKVQEVRDPGYFSKQLMQAAMASAVITTEDCGTARGIPMSVGARDIHDRVLAADFSAKGMIIPKGTTLSPDVVTKIRSLDKDANLMVRSTLKCEHEKGVCQKCAGVSPNGGFYKIGTNLGVLSAQSLGERSVQLTLKAFHSGGVSTGGSGTVNSFKRVQDLTLLPDNLADSATIAMTSGTIEKVEPDATGTKIWIGGKMHHVGKDRAGQSLAKPLAQVTPASWTPPRVGMRVEAGHHLSDPARTFVNPHDLYKATGSMERVQGFLTDELHRIYAPEGVRRQNVETVVRSMGELTKVRDPGDAQDVLKGEYRNASHIRAINRDLAKQNKRTIEHSPILKGIDVLPLVVQEDWMAKMMHQKLKSTILEAAATGAVSNIHGLHPVPGMAYAAEFGLTKKDSLKPRLGHLKNVADHMY